MEGGNCPLICAIFLKFTSRNRANKRKLPYLNQKKCFPGRDLNSGKSNCPYAHDECFLGHEICNVQEEGFFFLGGGAGKL